MNVKHVPYENGFEPMPDMIVCFNRWAGSDVTDGEREYVPVIRCRECRHFCRSPICHSTEYPHPVKEIFERHGISLTDTAMGK